MRPISSPLPGMLAALWLVLDAAPAAAGMPSVTLTDAAAMRLETMSFFLMLFLASALVIRWIWNSLHPEFPRLPRLSYPKAVGLVALWGLLFLVVLTMISGARELMTPGAWKKEGLTYTLDDGKKPPVEGPPAQAAEDHRRANLLALFGALNAYALQHGGRLPVAGDSSISEDLWKTPHASRMRYVYRPDCTIRDSGRILACEPELFGEGRLVLFANGDVKRMTTAELTPLLSQGTHP